MYIATAMMMIIDTAANPIVPVIIPAIAPPAILFELVPLVTLGVATIDYNCNKEFSMAYDINIMDSS